MKLETVEHKKNVLMGRDEYLLSLEHSGKATPSRLEILKELASTLEASEDTIIIDKIWTKTGLSVSDLKVLVYKKKDDIPSYKAEKMKRRTFKKKDAEEPAAEAKPVAVVKATAATEGSQPSGESE
jgi:ribosomal protein S24E